MINNKSNNIRIVLVETSHPGNIGASARAMKNMGLSRLYLVKPKKFPNEIAQARAAHAIDILNNAVISNSLQEALFGCSVVMGTSSRLRIMSRSLISADVAAKKIATVSETQEIALVFGREMTGLNNKEYELCHEQVYIPASEEYSSLNLGAAVQIMAYEIYLAMQHGEKIIPDQPRKNRMATSEELEGLIEQIKNTAIETGFLKQAKPRKMIERFRQIISRSEFDKEDVNLFRGLLTSMEKYTDREL